LFENLYLECYFAIIHLLNRTLIKNLNWKSLNICLNRALKKSYNLIIEISHLKIYDCKTYSLLKDKDVSLKSKKLKSRAFVDYLIKYDSLNIFRVWNLETWMISDYRNVIFDENQTFDTYIKQNLIIEEKMIEFVKLKVYDLESYVLNLRNKEERWLFISIRNRSSLAIKNLSALNVLAQLTAKDVSIRIIQQSTFENTSSSSVQLLVSSASLIEKRVKSYSSVESLNHLSEINQISIDLIAFSKSDRDIDLTNFNVANIVERKRARKQIKKFVNFVMITIISSHQDSLSFVLKHWRDMKRHSHSKKIKKIVNFEYQILIKMKTFIVVFKSSN
jgi:hypothetical protein